MNRYFHQPSHDLRLPRGQLAKVAQIRAEIERITDQITQIRMLAEQARRNADHAWTTLKRSNRISSWDTTPGS